MAKMNLILMLAFSILLPASVICGENVSESKYHNYNYTSKSDSAVKTVAEAVKKSNSSNSLQQLPNVIVKREIPEANEMPYYRIPMAIMSKRSATVLNKLIFALRSSFDKPVQLRNEIEITQRGNEIYPMDGSTALARGSDGERFPSAQFERRGQKDRKIYLRCYFNAVSCFKRK